MNTIWTQSEHWDTYEHNLNTIWTNESETQRFIAQTHKQHSDNTGDYDMTRDPRFESRWSVCISSHESWCFTRFTVHVFTLFFLFTANSRRIHGEFTVLQFQDFCRFSLFLQLFVVTQLVLLSFTGVVSGVQFMVCQWWFIVVQFADMRGFAWHHSTTELK